ncbi:MAG: hypothetical protein AB7F99_09495 [Vicinamibacterales bacterium]
MNSFVSWAGRRGYSFTEDHDEARFWCVVFLVPRHRRSEAMQKAWDDMEKQYPPRMGAVVSTTGVAKGEDGDRRELSREDLDALDRTDFSHRSTRGDF